MKKYTILGLLFLYFTLANQAQAAFLCPNTYRYIDVGAKLEEVRQACGAPTVEQKKRGFDTEIADVEQWVYNIDYAGYPERFPKLGDVPRQMLIFTIQNGQVASISVGGKSWEASDRCGGTVKVGDQPSVIRAACGTPRFVNKGQSKIRKGIVEFIIWTYDFGQYQPKAIMTFKKGVLISIQQSQ